jgi:MarR family transcriptional regulator, transcriptional regulator for hemolysin
VSATTAPPVTSAALSENLCWLLARASQVLVGEFTEALEGHGISPRGHAVLSAAREQEATQSQLARMVGLDKTTMVATIDELEGLGYAERVASPTDRRVRVIHVTAAGKRRMAQADKILERVREDVLSALPDDERDIFLHSLATLACNRAAEPLSCTPSVLRTG